LLIKAFDKLGFCVMPFSVLAGQSVIGRRKTTFCPIRLPFESWPLAVGKEV
jgi:hypothetical protein